MLQGYPVYLYTDITKMKHFAKKCQVNLDNSTPSTAHDQYPSLE